MAIFQNTVLAGYLKLQDNIILEKAYNRYTKYFHNPKVQRNIKESKEEQFQEGFLRELFVNILDYTLYPEPDFNLTTELKNEANAKKTDGAIIKDEKALSVIELKSTKIKDLESIRQQAFDYKANQTGCVYVITSNFEKLRFYINDAVSFEEFNLFNLTKDRFDLLYLCLHKNNLLNNVPLRIKSESLVKEEEITKQFYADYSIFKRELFRNLVKKNMKNEVFRSELLKDDTSRANKNIKQALFKKSQKLIDRFLFIFFAEDRGLLPANSTLKILKDWDKLNELDEHVPLYKRFKLYFKYLDQGRKGTENKAEIFAYNGGLFKPDSILDSLLIDDELLYNHTKNLSDYDFNSQVDVNILGHIFENSLNEIESVNAEIEGMSFDQQKTKRKKDGVFYTPKYITKYIVDNTVGKLCADKKEEIGIIEEEYHEGRQKATKQKLLDKLETYREWLLQISICDPACGSGAFLNQTLDFLINEHQHIDELQENLLGGSIVFPNIEITILENNIYGVDINEESVEIAKLSLWLRTAQPRRKLNVLSNNLKCGNSLISDTKLGGEKAFNWQIEFPDVFEKGGFDVVIGNPPYVQLQSMGEMSDTLAKCGYESFHKGADLYCLFTERGFSLLKKGGLQSFIMPNKWMIVDYGKPLRKFLSKTAIRQILNFGDIQFFEEATTYVCIFVIENGIPSDKVQVLSLNRKSYDGDFLSEVKAALYNYNYNNFGQSSWVIKPYEDSVRLEQMERNSVKLKDLNISIYRGILTGYNDAFYIDEAKRNELIKEDHRNEELIMPMIRGRDISAYGYLDNEFIINTHNGLKNQNPPIKPIDVNEYPTIKKHLDYFYEKLEKRQDKGNTPYNLRNCAYLSEFEKPKIMYPNMTSVFPFLYDESGILGNQKCFILTANDETISLEFLTALLNSSLAKLWIWYNCPELQGGTREISKVYFEHFPVPKASDIQVEKMSKLACNRTNLTKELFTLTSKFQRAIQRNLEVEKLSNKLQEWHLLSFADFVKELKKKKVKLSLTQQSEWEDYFEQESKKASDLTSQISKTDKEIDKIVHQLYGVAYE
jgi:type I restriction-modification system DNA methylase subunit